MFEFRPLNAGITAPDSAGGALDIDNASVVLVSAEGKATITTTAGTGDGSYPLASFFIPPNNMAVIHKQPMQKVYSSSSMVTLTKIAFPRG